MEILLKSMLCLLILLGVYRLLLQSETMYRFNRFYLLIAVLSSFAIPFLTIEQAAPEIAAIQSAPEFSESVVPVLDYTSEPLSVIEVADATPFDWMKLVWIGYGLVSLILLIRFIRNIHVLRNKIQRNLQVNYKDQILLILEEESLPFSFLNYIFVSKTDFESGQFTDAVFEHERTHVIEKHSWDILFMEALLVPFWFHPGLHLAKQAIKLNHEFIADQVALQKVPVNYYQSQILKFATHQSNNALVSSLNFSLTKKRLEMMTRKTKPTNMWLKLAFLIPVFGVVIYLFSDKVVAQLDQTSQKQVQQETELVKISPNRSLIEKTSPSSFSNSSVGELVNSSGAFSTYQYLKDEYQAKLDVGVHFIQKTDAEQAEIQAMFADLSGQYFRLSDTEKRQAGRPVHPFAPYLKIESNGKKIYKMPEDLTESEWRQFSTSLGQIERSEELMSYNRELNSYELNRNKGQHYIDKPAVGQKMLMDYYQKTQRQYALLPLEEKQLTKAPTHPFSPYVRLGDGLDSYFKLMKDLTEEERKNMAC